MHRCSGGRAKGGGGELVHSRCSKHPTSSKNLASIGSAPNSSVLYLFIWVGGQMYVQWRWISVTGRIKERHHKWSCQSGPTAGSRGEHPSLAHFIMIAVKPHSKKEREKGEGKKKKRKPSSPWPERKKKRQNERRCIIAVHDGMNYECVEGIRKQWLKSLGSSPSFLTLSPATN